MVRREFLRLASLTAAGIGYAPFGVSRGEASPALQRLTPWSPSALKIGQGRLLLEGQPFTVRGVVYQPTPVGEDPTTDGGPFSAYSEPRIRQRDFPRLRKLGANLIRVYQPREMTPQFFRDSLEAGLYVMLGFNVDTRYDLTADWARRQMLEEFRQFVRTWRGQPSILFWALGNGVNAELRRTGREAHLKAWHSLADAMAKVAHEEEGGQGRPVVLVSSEGADVGVPELGSEDAALPNVDLWGVNAYRGASFGSLFDDLKTTKPLLITEFGLDIRPRGRTPEPDQIPRAHAIVNMWNEIAARPEKVAGGCVFEYTDEWWRGPLGRPTSHDWGGGRLEAQPEGIANLEWFGLYSVSPRAGGLDQVSERPIIRYLTHAWTPLETAGRREVRFDVPLGNDSVEAEQRVSGRYAGLKPGWEIFLTMQPVGSPMVFVQPESYVARAASGSWVMDAKVGPKPAIGDAHLDLSTLVARTPEAAAGLRDVARGRSNRLPPQGIFGQHEVIRVRRR